MKSLLRCFSLAVAMAAAPLAAHADVVNPGFETGSLAPWTQGRNFGSSAVWTVTNSFAHTGSFSATTPNNVELVQNFAAIDVSTITSISFWAEHPNSEVNALAYDLFYTNGSDHEFIVNTVGTNWTFFDITSSLTSGLFLSGISFFGNTAGVTFLDDVHIVTNAAPPPTGVPEPLTLSLFGAGLAGAVVLRRCKKA